MGKSLQHSPNWDGDKRQAHRGVELQLGILSSGDVTPGSPNPNPTSDQRIQFPALIFFPSFFLLLLFLISTWYVNIRNSLIKKKEKKKISYTHFESQAQLCKRQLALTQGYISTQVSYFFYPKHPLSLFSVVFLEYPIIKLQAKWIKLNLLF